MAVRLFVYTGSNPPPPPLVGPVTNARATATTTTSVSLAWTNPTQSSFTGVMIRRAAGTTPPATPTSGTQVVNTSGPTASYTDSGLATGQQYSYALFAHDAVPRYANADTVTATTGTPALGPVTNARATATTTTSISLAWTNPTQPSFAGVMVRRATGTTPPANPSAGTLVVDTSGATASLTDSGLTSGATYSYALFAHDATPTYAAGANVTATTGTVVSSNIIMYGATRGGGGTAAGEITRLSLGPGGARGGPGNCLRSYTSGGPSFPATWSQHSQAASVPANIANFVSVQPGADFGTNSSKWTTMAGFLASIPNDGRSVGITLHHEADISGKSGAPDAAQYNSMHRKLCDLVQTENASRGSNHIFVYTCMTADGVRTGRANTYIDLLKTETRIRYFGWDCYAQANLVRVQNYASANRLTWMIPEVGAILGEFPGDDQFDVEMANFHSVWSTGWAADVVIWFDTTNQNGTVITTPKALARYRGYCAESRV